MKKILIISICLLISCWVNSSNNSLAKNSTEKESITILSSPDLYKLAYNWVDEYSKVNPKVNIKLVNLEDANLTDGTITGEVLYFVSSEYQKSVGKDFHWKMVIGTDAIVPIINSKNPFIEKIYQQGISSETIAKLLMNPEKQVWGSLFGSGGKDQINFYEVENEFISKGIGNYLKIETSAYPVIKVNSSEELIDRVQKDRNAIGFCKLYNTIGNNKGFIEKIKLLPIDVNGNGKLDYNEKIYENLNDFLRGLMIGKYPKTISSNLYILSTQKPSNENKIAFISWVLTDGQKYLNSNGFADLAYNQRLSSVDRMIETPVSTVKSSQGYIIPIVILIIGAIVAVFFTIDYAIRKIKTGKFQVGNISKIIPSVFNENSLVVPNGLFFDKTHTWAYMKKNGVVEIGIDDFLQHVTGPITRMKMKNPGEKVKKGDLLLSLIQDGKQISIYSPISGEIKEQNKRLISDTSLFNSSPYTDGWVYIVEPSNWLREAQFMVVAEKYREWIKNEFIRLKDFFSISLRTNNLEYASLVLQDGGEIRDHILRNFGPEVWDDFQTKFIDSSR